MSKKSIFAVIVGVASLALLIACGEANNGTTTTGGNATATPQQTHFRVGQQVKSGNYVVTVNSFKVVPGDEFTQPKAGDEFVSIDVTIKNTSSTSQDFSSDLSFTLLDSTGQKYTQTILTGLTPPDGTIAAGALLRGQMALEVPKSQKAYTLQFQPDLLDSSVLAIWDLSL